MYLILSSSWKWQNLKKSDKKHIYYFITLKLYPRDEYLQTQQRQMLKLSIYKQLNLGQYNVHDENGQKSIEHNIKKKKYGLLPKTV